MTEKDDGRAAPARGSQPVYDDTDVPDDVLKDANRTTPDVDRGAFNPRGRLGAAGKAGKGAFLIGACFVGFIVDSMAAQRSEERRVGQECVSPGRSRGWQCHK